MDSREFRVPGTRTISPYHRHAGGSRTKSRAHRWLQVGTRLTHPLESDLRRLTRATYPKRPRTRSFASRARRNLPSAPRGPATRPATRSATCPGTRSRPFPRRSPRIRPRRAASSPPRPSSRSPRDAPSPFDAHAACGPLEPLPVTVHLPSPYPTRPDRRRETRPPRTRRRRARRRTRRRRRRTTSRPSFPHLSRDARANRPVVDTNTNRRVSIRILIATTTLRRTRRRAPSPSRPASRRRFVRDGLLAYRRFVRDVRLCPRRSRRRFFELRLARRARGASSRRRRVRGARSRASPRVDASRFVSAPSPFRASPRGLRPADRPARAARRWRDTPPEWTVREMDECA